MHYYHVGRKETEFLEVHEQLDYTGILTDLGRINLVKKLYNPKTKYLIL